MSAATKAHGELDAPDVMKDRVADLIYKEKTDGLTPNEKSELDSCMRLEHLGRLVKARARQ